MKKITLLVIFLIFNSVISQSNIGLHTLVTKFDMSNQVNRVGIINTNTGFISNVGSATNGNSFNLTGGAFSSIDSKMYLSSGNSTITAFDINQGSITETPINTFYSGTSYFDNISFSTSNGKLYGLYRPFDTDFNSTGIYLANVNLNNGDINVLSQNSIASSYKVAGTAIDPKLMVYYFKTGTTFTGVDLYNGSIFTNPNVVYDSGDFDFANFTYNCDDNIIYGLVREMTNLQDPNAPQGVNLQYMRLAKINPNNGVVTRISDVTLPRPYYSANGGSTIDPVANIYYYSDNEYLYAVSLTTGLLVSQTQLTFEDGLFISFMNNYNECFGATITRLDPNLGLFNPNSLNKIVVYPIPSDDFLNITTSYPISKIEIFDSNGRMIKEAISNNNLIDIKELKVGLYFLKVATEGSNEFIKFIKN